MEKHFLLAYSAFFLIQPRNSCPVLSLPCSGLLLRFHKLARTLHLVSRSTRALPLPYGPLGPTQGLQHPHIGAPPANQQGSKTPGNSESFPSLMMSSRHFCSLQHRRTTASPPGVTWQKAGALTSAVRSLLFVPGEPLPSFWEVMMGLFPRLWNLGGVASFYLVCSPPPTLINPVS